jgi:hypothetical protein
MFSAIDGTVRRRIYLLLILVTMAVVCARILSAQILWEPVLNRDDGDYTTFRPRIWPKQSPDPVPTFGSNDRSRWATVVALVDDGTYVIGRREPALVSKENKYGYDGIIFDSDGWRTIDVVLNPETQKFYSSKPPLLATLVAGEYWLLKHGMGWSLKSPTGTHGPDDRWKVVRTVLLTINAIPMLIYLLLLAKIIEEHGTTDWGRILVMAAACFGTMLTPFAVTFNNHSIATCCALFALYPAMRLLSSAKSERGALAAFSWAGEFEQHGAYAARPPILFITAGFFAALTACLELPAVSFAVLLCVVLLLWYPRHTLVYYVPPALIPATAFVLTNYLAVGQLTPVYEKFGTEWYEYPGSVWNVTEREAAAEKDREEGRPIWEFRNIDWAWHPQGAHETKLAYAFHLLIGHHGLFSLMPIFLLALPGMFLGCRRMAGRVADLGVVDVVSMCSLVLLVVVIGFYIFKSNNYGGWTNGPRWLMWLAPLLLITMLPIADRLATLRWGRGLAYFCLAVSVFSVNYWSWNPWRHPWLYNLMESNGWIQY